jgi:hypothetical protein
MVKGMKKSIPAHVVADPVLCGIRLFPTLEGFCPPMLRRSPLAAGLTAKGGWRK